MALRYFEAASRHTSFSRASEELGVSAPAIGQQIRRLENELGVSLFNRTPKGLELTVEGQLALGPLREGLAKFSEAIGAMQSHLSVDSISIAAPSDLVARWLAPQLQEYTATRERLRVHIVCADGDFNLERSNCDLAVMWALNKGNCRYTQLGGGGLITIGEGRRIGWPGDPSEDCDPIMIAGDADIALQAALAGLGHARIPKLIAGRHTGKWMAASGAYWLISPSSYGRRLKVKSLVELLMASAAEHDATANRCSTERMANSIPQWRTASLILDRAENEAV